MKESISTILEQLPPDHPLSHFYRYYFKTPIDGYSNGGTELTNKDITYIPDIINNQTFWPNYLKTFIYLTAIRLQDPTIRPPLAKEKQHQYPFDVTRNLNHYLDINEPCRARIFEGIWEFIYPFHASWIKQYPIEFNTTFVAKHQTNLRFFASPEINDQWKFWTKSYEAFDSAESIKYIASNPWITPKTAMDLSMHFREQIHYMKILIRYLSRNESLPLEFIQEWKSYLLQIPLAIKNKQILEREVPTLICQRTDCPHTWITNVDPESHYLYPNSTAEDIERFLKKTIRETYRVKEYWIKAFRHPNCSTEIKHKILNTKRLNLIAQLLEYNNVSPWYRLKYGHLFPDSLRKVMLIEQTNEKYKTLVNYILSISVSPEQFFIKSIQQFKVMVDEVTNTYQSKLSTICG